MFSQKCQYALRAVFELAKRAGQGPVKIATVADAQAIPARFLEVILGQLKRGRFADSKRGAAGGYELARSPSDLTVGEVIRFVEGPLDPVMCMGEGGAEQCPLYAHCVFLPMWRKASGAMADVYDRTTFQELVEDEKRKSREYVASYSI